jgi:uncharacterized spore protein YtfJ
MTVHEFSQAMIERLQSSATVRIVYGDPLKAHGKTIIPVARVAFGFGGGLAPGRLRPQNLDRATTGEGGGGGVAATPVGVIEITDDETRFVPIAPSWHLWAGVAAGLLAGIVLGRRS